MSIRKRSKKLSYRNVAVLLLNEWQESVLTHIVRFTPFSLIIRAPDCDVLSNRNPPISIFVVLCLWPFMNTMMFSYSFLLIMTNE